MNSIPAIFTDDRYRCESIDGTVTVAPPRSRLHQRVLLRLLVAIEAQCPRDFVVLPAPFVIRPDDHTDLRPDAVVLAGDDVAEHQTSDPPVLVVEVSAPESQINDFHNKKAAYERLGVPTYWIVNPSQPSLVVFELVEGAYRRTAEVQDADVFEAVRPFPVRISPVELLDQPRE